MHRPRRRPDAASPAARSADADLGETTSTNGGGLGDSDDILALTVRSEASRSSPTCTAPTASSRNLTEAICTRRHRRADESNLAEVIWYAANLQPDDPSTPRTTNPSGGEPGMRTLYRRVLLIAPWLPRSCRSPRRSSRYDGNVSVHRELLDPTIRSRATWVPNTLADLTRREYRFAHEYDRRPDTTSTFRTSLSA